MIRTLIVAACVTHWLAMPSYGVLIDSFQTPQLLVSNGQPVISQVFGNGMVGGYRDAVLQSLGPNEGSIDIQGGHLTFTTAVDTNAQFALGWDGVIASFPLSPNTSGLGDVDMTQGGTLNALAVTVSFSNQPFEIEFNLFQSGNRHDHGVVSIPGGVLAPTTFVVRFADFTIGSSSGVRADYSRINAVNMGVIPDTSGLSFQLDCIETVFVPEPSSIALACVGLIALAGWRVRPRSGSNRPQH